MKTILATALALVGISTALAQTTINLNVPDAPKSVVTQNATQIELIKHTPKTSLKPIQLAKPFGPTYTLTFWIKLNDNPAYAKSGFSDENPVTIVDLHAKNINEQRAVIRVANNKLELSEFIEPNKAKAFGGISPKLEAGKWYFLAYTHTPTQGLLYVNAGTFTLRSAAPSPQEKIQNITFGRFQSRRFFDGDIAQPRLYTEALTLQQIQSLYKTPPPSAQ